MPGECTRDGRGEYAQPGHGVGILASNYCLRGARNMRACGSWGGQGQGDGERIACRRELEVRDRVHDTWHPAP